MVCMGLAILFAWGAVLVMSVGSAALVYTMLHPKRKTYAHALACGVPGDPGEMGWAAREISYDFPDGTSSPAWLIEGENPVGPVVVFIHGWSSSRVMALSRVAPRACSIGNPWCRPWPRSFEPELNVEQSAPD